MRKKYFGDLQFYKSVLLIAVPAMGQLFVTTLVSLIDSFMVARLGDIKMSGVNISNQIFFIVYVVTSALAMAGGIFLAQYSGAKQKDGMQQAYRFKMLLALSVSLISMFVVVCFGQTLLFAMVRGNISANEIVPYGKEYLWILLWSFIPFGISVAISSSLRETGSQRLPLVITLIVAVVNAVGNYALIFGKLGMPRLEVAGAAYSTVFARIVEMLLFIAVARKKDFYVKFLDIWKVKLSVFKEIVKRSSWLLMSDLLWAFTETIINALYNGLGGSAVVSGMSAGWTISDLFFLTHAGLGTAITVIVGGLLGQNKLEEAREKARWFLSLGFIVGIGVGIIEIVSSFILVPLIFGELSPVAQKVALNLLIMVAFYMPVWSWQNAQYYILLAGGDSFSFSMIETTINIFVSLPIAFLMVHFTRVSPVALYGIIKISSLIKPVWAHFALKKETWIKNLTQSQELEAL